MLLEDMTASEGAALGTYINPLYAQQPQEQQQESEGPALTCQAQAGRRQSVMLQAMHAASAAGSSQVRRSIVRSTAATLGMGRISALRAMSLFTVPTLSIAEMKERVPPGMHPQPPRRQQQSMMFSDLYLHHVPSQTQQNDHLEMFEDI